MILVAGYFTNVTARSHKKWMKSSVAGGPFEFHTLILG